MDGKFIGAIIVIKNKKHPHYGEICEIIGKERINIIGQSMIKVKGEFNEFFVNKSDFYLMD